MKEREEVVFISGQGTGKARERLFQTKLIIK